MFFDHFFQIFYSNEKKRSRIAVSPLLPTRPRAPWIMESGASIIDKVKMIPIFFKMVNKVNNFFKVVLPNE